MKIAICEDEMICTDILETHIRKWATDNGIWVEVFTYESAEQFLFYLNENAETDLLFLDIKLSGINGVELAKKLRGMKHTMQIVFTTDTEKYVYEGYNVAALNYLVKPVNKEALAESIGRIFREQDSLFIEADGTLKNFRYADIEYVEASANYVVMKVAGSDKTTRLRATLSETLKKLGNDRFARCHKGYLVNLGHIHEVRTNHIVLHNGDTVPLGRQYRTELQKNILEYIEKAIPR